MNLKAIPPEIIYLITEYLWGSSNIWKNKLDIKPWKLSRRLLSLKFYPRDTTYCAICGEKKYIFNYNTIACFPCNNPLQNFCWKYTTWSGTNQGHFKLHGKIICLHSGPLSPLEKNILCVSSEYPNIHPIP